MNVAFFYELYVTLKTFLPVSNIFPILSCTKNMDLRAFIYNDMP